jgi:hypothetical protein
VPATDEIWVLGQSLYKDYYMTHDPDEQTITFVPTEKGLKSPLQMGDLPATTFQKGFDYITFGLKFLGMALSAIATYGLVQMISSGQPISFLESASREERQTQRVFRTDLFVAKQETAN